MIPKIIHYCWFGGKPLLAQMQAYIETWKKYLPDYELKRWDESNLPPDSRHLKLLLRHRKWAFVSDYVRLYALYTEGGIYLDTDIEVVRPFDPLLGESCFIGFQQKGPITQDSLNGAVIGAVPGHPYIKDCLDLHTNSFYARIKPILNPVVMSRVAIGYGLDHYGDQVLRGVRLFPTEAFYPYHWLEEFRPEQVTADTFCIHRWENSWNRPRSGRARIDHLLYKLGRSLFILTSRWRKRPV